MYKQTKSYQILAEEYLSNILSIAEVDITKQIEIAMTKPLMVSKTMANDEFLKKWFANEQKKQNRDGYMKELYSYLNAYKEKYGFTTVFCVSAQTGNYIIKMV